MRNSMLRFVAPAILALVWVAACGSSNDTPSGQDCVPGSTQACFGPAACEGAQVCLADGSGWGRCDCGSTTVGGHAGEGGSSGSTGGTTTEAGGTMAPTAGTENGGTGWVGGTGNDGGRTISGGTGGADTGGSGGDTGGSGRDTGGSGGDTGGSGGGGTGGDTGGTGGMGGGTGGTGGAIGGTGGCTTECTNRECGPDPLCPDISCGQCSATEACTDDGRCGCIVGTPACSADGYGFRVCGADATPGIRVPCNPGYACNPASGLCNRPSCSSAEVMFVLDRSSSMQTIGALPWVMDAIRSSVFDLQQDNRLGIRQFPSNSACNVNTAVLPALNNLDAILTELDTEVSNGATPVAAALANLSPEFGDANDAQAAILVTEGDENCATQTAAIEAAQALWTAGIQVHVLAVTTTADRVFLDQIAEVGGTGQSHLVSSFATMSTELARIFDSLNACECDAACQCGDGELNPFLEECDDGNAIETDGCTSLCRANGKTIFKTSTEYTGDLGGLAGADAICQSVASSADLTGTYRAWLSTESTSAASRLTHSTEPYVLTGPDRPVVAQDWDDLVDGSLLRSINRNERGTTAGDTYVWTGTDSDGSTDTSYGIATCNDWTTTSSGESGTFGRSTHATQTWTNNFNSHILCNGAIALYCVEQ